MNIVNDDAIADLHVHTTASDGSFSAREILREIATTKLRTLAITDHHTTKACLAGKNLAELYGINLLNGIEISTNNFKSCHVLGYGVEKLDELNILFERIAEEKEQRLLDAVNQLEVRHGIVLGNKFIEKNMTNHTLTRKGLLAEFEREGYKKNLDMIKREYLWPLDKTPLKIQQLTVEKAINTIKDAGGVPVLAHPWTLTHRNNGERLRKKEFEQTIGEFQGLGIEGLECSAHTDSGVEYYSGVAREMGLLQTGGSDFHCYPKSRKLGSCIVTRENLDRLCDRIDARH